MVKRPAAVIPEIIGNHKKTDPICLVWKDDMTNNSEFLHEENTAQARNGENNQSSNNEDTKEEAKLDLHARKSENMAITKEMEKTSNNEK
jgi:hypothetical protein